MPQTVVIQNLFSVVGICCLASVKRSGRAFKSELRAPRLFCDDATSRKTEFLQLADKSQLIVTRSNLHRIDPVFLISGTRDDKSLR